MTKLYQLTDILKRRNCLGKDKYEPTIMSKFKLTLISGLVVEHFSDTMIQAIKYVEHRFETTVVKAERVV